MAGDGIRTHYKLWDGTKWVKYWFTTSADAIHEVTDRRFVTDTQKDLLDLGTNVANGLLKLNASKKVDITLLPDLSGTYALVGHDHDTVYSKLNHNHSGVYEPVFTKKTAFNKDFAGTGTATTVARSDHDHDTVYSKLNHNHSGIYEPVFTKKTAFNKDFAGTGTATTVARSDHDHDGVYEPGITKNSAFNLNKATQAQAEAGAVDTVLMTPLRTKQAILKLAPAPADATDTVKGIVKLSGNFNADTPDINTALSQTGAKNLYDSLKNYADTVTGMGFSPQQEVDLAYVRESDSPNSITISDFGSRPPAPQFPADDDSITQLRVLISGRNNEDENGIYKVVKNTTGLEGSWKWQLEASSQDHGAIVFVKGGTHNDTIWYYNKTSKVWNQFSRMDTIHDSTTIKKAFQQASGFQLEIIPGSIKSGHIASGVINSAHLGSYSVTSAKLGANAVTEDKINDGAVTEDKIADLAVTEDKIANKTISNSKIKNYTIVATSIADGAVITRTIGYGAVTGIKIADGAVTEAKLATDAVTTNKIKDGNVTNVKLADNAVTEDKINNSAVTSIKISNGAVTSAKLADSAVITDKINDGAVTSAKLADSAVITDKINDGAVTADKLESNAVTTVKINNSAVTSAKIATGAVTEAKLATSVKELIKKITVGTSAPSNPNVGDVWLDTSVS